MSVKRAFVAVTMMLVLGAGLVGCADSDVQKGTYVGWGATFEGEDTRSYMVELDDGTKIMAFGEEPAPEVGDEVTVRQLEGGTWEIVPDE